MATVIALQPATLFLSLNDPYVVHSSFTSSPSPTLSSSSSALACWSEWVCVYHVQTVCNNNTRENGQRCTCVHVFFPVAHLHTNSSGQQHHHHHTRPDSCVVTKFSRLHWFFFVSTILFILSAYMILFQLLNDVTSHMLALQNAFCAARSDSMSESVVNFCYKVFFNFIEL